MMVFRRPRPTEIIAVALTALLLVGLGAWQLQRLEWKQGLLREVNQAQTLPVLGTLPEDVEALKKLQYRRVLLAGHWLKNKPALHLISQQSNGYVWLAPFQLEDSDQIILAPLGWLPAGAQPKPEAYRSPVEGWLRAPKTQRLFSPPNHPEKNVWFTEDIPAMQQAVGVKLLPVVVETQPVPPLRNDHLGYAIIWFLLAGACVGMFVIALREKPLSDKIH